VDGNRPDLCCFIAFYGYYKAKESMWSNDNFICPYRGKKRVSGLKDFSF
jgi:hypothetical protein